VSALLTIVHIIICLVLILAVLLQSGKSADLAGAFGGGGSQTVFGPRGSSSLLSKVTTICAVLFMVTSLGLWIISAKGYRSKAEGAAAPAETKPAASETVKDTSGDEATEKQSIGGEEKQKDQKEQNSSEAETD